MLKCWLSDETLTPSSGSQLQLQLPQKHQTGPAEPKHDGSSVQKQAAHDQEDEPHTEVMLDL